jgi:hypothetical protein
MSPAFLNALQRTDRRLRLRAALKGGLRALVCALALAVITIALRKLGFVSERPARIALGVLAGSTVAAFLIPALLRRASINTAMHLDAHHHLHDRLANALAFSAVAPSARSGWMLAAIADADERAVVLDPKAACPVHAPRDALLAVPLALLLVLSLVFEVRRHELVAPTVKIINPVDVTADDLEALREFAKQLEQRAQDPETKAALEEFNKLVEDLSKQRLDRDEAFKRMQALEERLGGGLDRSADRRSFEEALSKVGNELNRSELAKPIGEALAKKDFAKAEQAMRDLAKNLREAKNKGAEKAKLDQLREALKKAANDAKRQREDLLKKRDQAKEDLLKQKQTMGDGGANEEERSLLDKKQRELDRLDRELDQAARNERQLDRLDRELSKAAEDLLKDMGASASDLERGAEDLNRMSKEQMSEREKQDLIERLKELREQMRREGQSGQGKKQRMKRFQKRARGGKGQQGEGQGGKEGQEQGEGEGQEGQGGKEGQGQGQEQGGKNGEVWVVGPGGKKMLLLSRGQGQGQSQGGDQKGSGYSGGSSHGANVSGKGTNPNLGTQDSELTGQDTGQGGSNSRTIRGAASRGFASRAYKKTYREYHTVAEDTLAHGENKDAIPGGYRFYVRRYFDLIRPREP